MADVARLAGVSIATVSRALRDVPGVSAATRERIRQIADDLFYVISPEASALSSGHTGRVAIVLPRLDTWFYSTMLASMAPVLRDAELDMLVYQVDGEAQRNRFLHDLPSRRKADAVVLTALPMADAEVERLDLMGVHVVVAGGRVRDYPHVHVDDQLVGRMAVQHLVDQGHRRIGMIRTSDTDGITWSSDIQRAQAWRDTLAAAGLPASDELLITETWGPDAGARGLSRLMDLPDRPTAVFAYSDEIAVAAIARARDLGIRVPEDLSVIGVDGHPMGEVLDVSTVDQHVAEQAVAAAHIAVGLLGGTDQELSTTITPHLVPRGSVAPVRS